MATLKIITEPDPRYSTISDRLRQKSEKVTVVDDDLRKLARDMHETMVEACGVGLAAPQVGILKRLVVVQVPAGYQDEDSPELNLALVNPEIARAGGQECDAEGCLSFPELYGDVTRYASVTVKAKDLDGKDVKIKARGFLARVLQHEIDHLDGVLFFDRMDDLSSLRYPVRSEEERETATAESPAE
jgi:peptide deformylase